VPPRTMLQRRNRKIQLGITAAFQHLSLTLVAATTLACADCWQVQRFLPGATPRLGSAGLYLFSWFLYSWKIGRQASNTSALLAMPEQRRYGCALLVIQKAAKGFGHFTMVAGLLIRTGSHRVLLSYFAGAYMASWAGFYAWLLSMNQILKRSGNLIRAMTDARASAFERSQQLLRLWNGRSSLAVLLDEGISLLLVVYCVLSATSTRESATNASWKSELIALGLWEQNAAAPAYWLLGATVIAHLVWIGGNLLITVLYLAVVMPRCVPSSFS
jgi:hypothetical protein